MVRLLLGTGLLYGLSFLVFREQWTRFFARMSRQSTPRWFPSVFPYVAFGAAMLWSVMAYSGFFGAQ